ncbi:DUF333 domain-containing protein [Halomonas sp. AOP22-C1-8]|uniref:DUF333 domain-containing protein n=1 Tax=Halomonas sp. AOP22-C1-8 TaxID=3457717 RepID=UPI004033D037
MKRYLLSAMLLLPLAGCATEGSSRNAEEAHRYAVEYCEREGGEVRSRESGGTQRDYCHLVEGRVVEVNMLYRTEGLRND